MTLDEKRLELRGLTDDEVAERAAEGEKSEDAE